MKKLFFFFLNWVELGLVKGCLCLVGGYWASFGFSLGQGGALCKMLIFFFFLAMGCAVLFYFWAFGPFYNKGWVDVDGLVFFFFGLTGPGTLLGNLTGLGRFSLKGRVHAFES